MPDQNQVQKRVQTINTEDLNSQRATAVLRAMGNAHRMAILCHLSRTEANVTELQKVVGLSQSAISQHLTKLRHERLVQTRRYRQEIIYSLDGEIAEHVIDALRESNIDPCPA